MRRFFSVDFHVNVNVMNDFRCIMDIKEGRNVDYLSSLSTC